MRQKRLTCCVLQILCLLLTALYGQSTVVSAGGNASGSGGVAAFSVGQTASKFITGSTGSATQGVQQTFQISVLTATDEAANIRLLAEVYPNPTSGNLTLSIKGLSVSDVSYQLYDISGKLLKNEQVIGTSTTIGMSNLLSSTYILTVHRGSKEIKKFQIIKI